MYAANEIGRAAFERLLSTNLKTGSGYQEYVRDSLNTRPESRITTPRAPNEFGANWSTPVSSGAVESYDIPK